MATRRIPPACVAISGRNGLFHTSLPRRPPRSAFPAPRHFQTTSIWREQQANTKAKRDPAPKIVRGASKLFKDADAAVKDLKDGSVILSAGFGLCGTAGERYCLLIVT